MLFQTKKTLKENHVYIEKVISLRSQFSYIYVMMNMKLLSIVTPPYIYHNTRQRNKSEVS